VVITFFFPTFLAIMLTSGKEEQGAPDTQPGQDNHETFISLEKHYGIIDQPQSYRIHGELQE
jgi:hypothetical protein